MVVGGFLDSVPSALFIAAHVMFLALGIWAATRRESSLATRTTLFWLYALSQVGFLGFFFGLVTMKMAVLIEQMLVAVIVIGAAASSRTRMTSQSAR